MIFLLCCLLSMLEGFDIQAMAFAAPDVARTWQVEIASFGPVFSAGLLGGLVGGFLVGFFGHRFGPKQTLVASTILFSILTLATAGAASMPVLMILRFVAGIGLGAAIPGIVALVACYSPRRLRSTAVTVAVSCQLLGAVVGGVISAQLVPIYGWRAVFVLGGIAPLFLLPALIYRLPESLTFLAGKPDGQRRILDILTGFGKICSAEGVALEIARRPVLKTSFAELLADGRLAGTIFAWATCVLGSALLYFLLNWLPSILYGLGATTKEAILASVALNAGGVLGAIVLSRVMDKFSIYLTVASAYGSSALAIFLMANYQQPDAIGIGIILMIGFLGLGAQSCLTALLVAFYPAHLHNSGIGSALGFARVGAVIAPLFGSYVLFSGGGAREMFLVAAIAATAACVTTLCMNRTTRKSSRTEMGEASL